MRINQSSQNYQINAIRASLNDRSSPRSGHEEVASYLLDKGADVESFGYAGMRALHHACSNSHEGCIGLLLDRGADANAADEYGEM